MDKLTAYRIRNGKRVATYRIAVVYERDAATVYPAAETEAREERVWAGSAGATGRGVEG